HHASTSRRTHTPSPLSCCLYFGVWCPLGGRRSTEQQGSMRLLREKLEIIEAATDTIVQGACLLGVVWSLEAGHCSLMWVMTHDLLTLPPCQSTTASSTRARVTCRRCLP